MKRSKNILFTLLLFCAVLLPNSTQAGDWIKQGDEWLTISAGVFLAKIDSSVQVDNSTLGVGTGVDLENDLDLKEDDTTYWGSVTWRFAENHRISAGYFQFKRDASATAKTDLQIGDEIFPVGASLSTEFKLSVVPITYSYSFMKEEKYEFGASLGVHWDTINFDVTGSASLGNLDADASISAEAVAPMPLLGLFFEYHFTPKWTAGAHGEVFALDLDNDTFSFSGTIINLRLKTEYWFFNNVGLGAAISWFKLDVDVEDSDWKGELDYQYWGSQVYAAVRF